MSTILKLILAWLAALVVSLFLPLMSLAALSGTTYDTSFTTTTAPVIASKSISPKIKALSEANITDNGITVLGRFKSPPGQMNYIQKATTGKYKGYR